ncbi:MAG TPA: OmpA family protein [Rhizomicrobium sp.]|nr:OmpA family protein [Rhizomicrobium sp.]
MIKTIPFVQLTLALGVALGLSACQTVSDAASGVGDTVASAASALDPTRWFGGDDSAPPPPDAGTQTASTDTSARTTPDLANLPARPATSTPAQQQAAAQSLAADGAQARYSADSLRAGTEAAAAPPGAADVPPSAQIASAAAPLSTSASAPPSSANDAPPTTDSPPSAQPMPAQPATPAPPAPTTAAAVPPPALAQGTSAVPTGANPPSRPVQMAAVAPSTPAAVRPPGAEPAVPAVPANTPVRGAGMANQTASDAALGFKPSAAPPLDPSINQWVSAPIVARYRQTASNAGIAPAPMAAVPPKGSPADMSGGAVIANLDTISTSPAGMGTNSGATPTAVVFFPGDGTILSAAARTQIKNTVVQYKTAGGGGAIRVVGHASSRTANMPVEKHLELIFEKSQQRANAVAQELIHDGVPAEKVLIEAVGDSQPVFYESMPQGEEGNRRAEIFVQS